MPTKYGFESEQERREREEREKKDHESAWNREKARQSDVKQQFEHIGGLLGEILGDYLEAIGKDKARITLHKDDARFLWVIDGALDDSNEDFLLYLTADYGILGGGSRFDFKIEYRGSPFWQKPPIYPRNIQHFARTIQRVLSGETQLPLSGHIAWPPLNQFGEVASYENFH